MPDLHEHAVIAHHWKPGRGQATGTDSWECLPPGECTEPDGDVTAIFGHEVRADYYLPMDCPSCGRQRLFVIHTVLASGEPKVIVRCDKCGAREWDCDTAQHSAGGQHPQKASAWVEVW